MCWELNWWCLMIISRFFVFYLWCYLLSSAVTHNRLQKHYKIHEDSCILFGIVVRLCKKKKKKKISDVTVMQFCQVPVFNFYSVGHRCFFFFLFFLSISCPLSNVGSRRWLSNLSGSDPGTHTHTHTHTQKKKTEVVHLHVKKQETNPPICVSVVAAQARPLKDLAVVHLCIALSCWGVTLSEMCIEKKKKMCLIVTSPCLYFASVTVSRRC